MKRLVAVTMIALGATACGPHIALNVQTQNVPLAFALGKQAVVNTSPLAPVQLPPTKTTVPPIVISPVGHQATAAPTTGSTPKVTVPPVIKKLLCPALSPTAPISFIPAQSTALPRKATYKYRSTIDEVEGGKTSTFKGTTKWSIAPVSLGSKHYSFTVNKSVPKRAFSTTTSYEVITTSSVDLSKLPNPDGLLPSPPAAVQLPGQAGLYLQSTKTTGESASVFSNPVALVHYPITQGATFSSSGDVDGEVLSFTSTAVKQTKINACGTAVGVWQVTLSDGKITQLGGKTPSATFSETLDIDTTAGGIVVGDHYKSTSTGASPVTLNETDTANVDPKPAKVSS